MFARRCRTLVLVIAVIGALLGVASQQAQATHTAELRTWQVPGPRQGIDLIDQIKDIAVDPQGGIWYIYGGQGLDLVIGRLDPCTNTVRTWQVDAGDELATDVQNLVLDRQGRLYWTALGDPSDPHRKPYIGRLDPFAKPDEPNLAVWIPEESLGAAVVRPWGLVIDSREDSEGRTLLWFSDPEGHRLVQFWIDPHTSEVQIFSWSLPVSSRPTDIAIDEGGSVWFIGVNQQNFRTSIGRLDLTAASFPMTFTEWDVPAGGNLMVREGSVWASSSQGSAAILRLDPATDKLTSYPVEGLVQMAFDPQTPSKIWFTTTDPSLSSDAVGLLELRDKPAVNVGRATGEVSPMPPMLIIAKPLQRFLKEERVGVSPRLQEVTATVQQDLQLYPLPSGQAFPQGLTFRGFDLYFKTGTRTMGRLRPIPDDAQGPLSELCVTPLKVEVKAGETAVFTLTGGPPPICCDRALVLSVERIEPRPQSAEIKFQPFNFLGGFIGVVETQLKVKITTPGAYRITIRGTFDTGDFVTQVVWLMVKEASGEAFRTGVVSIISSPRLSPQTRLVAVRREAFNVFLTLGLYADLKPAPKGAL